MKTYQFNAIMMMLHYIASRLSPPEIAWFFMVMAAVFVVLMLITVIGEFQSSRSSYPKPEPKWF